MMNVKVNMEFIDRHTGLIHKQGDVFEATEERISEIMSVSKNLIEVVQDQQEAPAEAPVKKQERRKKVNE